MVKNPGRFQLALVLLLAATAGGCATYRQRISDDFRDTVKVNAGIGFGLYARAKATSYLDAGAGWGGYWENIGIDGRGTKLIHPSINGCPFPIGVIPGVIPDESPLSALRMVDVRDTVRDDLGHEYAVVGQLFDARAFGKWDAYGPAKCSPHVILHDHEDTYTDHPAGFEAGVGLLVVNVEVGFDPVEFCNLVGAIFGFDLLKDKRPPATAPAATEPVTVRK